ncbi:MAG: TFIIB-type zinc finger domain-containing protein [Candidatus Coatesbacteria bacterium]|nr:MAG: TFIIB-type zinc finger domain-containing protein [Candidatus Coatesbacteria bacterium]
MPNEPDYSPEPVLVAPRCPKCGGPLDAAETGRLTCAYCGTTLLAREVFGAKSVDLQKFYERALAAAEAGSYGQAYEYFDRILETDASEYQAWVGKGLAGAYAKLETDQQFEAGEVLSCLDMALEHFDGDDAAAFQRQLADRAGALAVDLFGRVMAANANDRKNLAGLLDLLYYWEAHGTEELQSWIAIVDVAEKEAIPPKARREPGTRYMSFDYPFKKVAKEYTKKIRAKYDAEFTNVFERGAAVQREIAKSLKKIGIIVLIIIAGLIGLGIITVVVLLVLGFLGFTYFF